MWVSTNIDWKQYWFYQICNNYTINFPLYFSGSNNSDLYCRLNSDGITAVYNALGSLAVRAENVHMFTQVFTLIWVCSSYWSTVSVMTWELPCYETLSISIQLSPLSLLFSSLLYSFPLFSPFLFSSFSLLFCLFFYFLFFYFFLFYFFLFYFFSFIFSLLLFLFFLALSFILFAFSF